MVTTFVTIYAHAEQKPKIVGLVPVRNEALVIEQCLKALACYTDAIIVLDDASEDETVAIVKSLAHECNVEKIIEKKIWYRDEPGDRNKLLQAGRAIGGTHFVVIDADEIFTAPCLKDNFLRTKIFELQPEQVLELAWIRLWKSLKQCRNEVDIKEFIFCDNGTSYYESRFIHTSRVPNKFFNKESMHITPAIEYGLLHFQAINWRNMRIRQAWYRCLEHIRNPKESIKNINKGYAASEDETNLRLATCPKAWFDGYTSIDFSAFEKAESWREKQILGWFEHYGRDFFAPLEIWDIDWNT